MSDEAALGSKQSLGISKTGLKTDDKKGARCVCVGMCTVCEKHIGFDLFLISELHTLLTAASYLLRKLGRAPKLRLTVRPPLISV